MTPKHERRLLALLELTALPDLADLINERGIGRGYRYTYPRDPRRDPDVIKRDLGTAYVAWRRQEHRDGDVSCVVSVRRRPLLRVVNGR